MASIDGPTLVRETIRQTLLWGCGIEDRDSELEDKLTAAIVYAMKTGRPPQLAPGLDPRTTVVFD